MNALKSVARTQRVNATAEFKCHLNATDHGERTVASTCCHEHYGQINPKPLSATIVVFNPFY